MKSGRQPLKVFVGISGGVDSAVAAYLLQQQGYEVHGVFMKNWSGENYGIEDNCPWKADLEASIAVCEHLGITHRTYNFEKEYREAVITDFFDEYKKGNTPNPDILCNRYIKFDHFLERALKDGADLIATGHYSRVINGQLHKAKDHTKDQTYFLAGVRKEKFEKVLFPLADLLKKEIRSIAEKITLPNAKRADSQGICFIGKVEMDNFLELEISHKPGSIVDIDSGRAVGTHKGVWFHTIGQRKGLNIGGLSEPYFVCGKDTVENILFVAKGKSHPALYKTEITFENYNLLSEVKDFDNISATIRYRSPDTTIQITEEQKVEIDSIEKAVPIKVKFATPQWTPAIGQYIVLFEGERCLGSGRITGFE
jgi:tRNA-uridine 2-sulfurtransferase